MNSHSKHILIGLLGYYLIMTISCIIFTEPGTGIIGSRFDAFVFCTCVGWLVMIPGLLFPGIVIIAIFTVSHLKKYAVSPYLISTSLILYPIGINFARHVFGFFKKGGELWQPLLIAGISCFLGLIIDRYRISRNDKRKRIAS